MCGIAGSKSRESGFDLYQQNLLRGCYSSSVVAIHKWGHLILKKEGQFSLDEIPPGALYYLFHSRGPTVETTNFDWNDNHPFVYGRFIVAHNGIIENANKLYGGDVGVDSRVIPWLIDQRFQHDKDPDVAIHNALNELQGTFGLWVYDTTTQRIYIVRSDITLFKYGTEFTSSNSGYLNEVVQNTMIHFDVGNNDMAVGKTLTLSKKPKYFIASSPKT